LHNDANETYAAFHCSWKLVFPNSYFRVGSRGAHRIPGFPLGNTTSNFNGMIFPTGKLANMNFRVQWNAALVQRSAFVYGFNLFLASVCMYRLEINCIVVVDYFISF